MFNLFTSIEEFSIGTIKKEN
jgi:hypothetical protein